MQPTAIASLLVVLAACAPAGADGEEIRQPESGSYSAGERAAARGTTNPEPSDTTAVALVREYVSRDARGERLGDEAWFSRVVTWPEEPGWDYVTVIQAFRVAGMTLGRDSARVEVRYAVAGIIEPADERRYRFTPDPSTVVQVFTVVREGSAWRIDSPQINQHITPQVAARHYSAVLAPDGVQHLNQLAAEAAAETPE